uniref:Elongation of very long chain fatty acids protein n=1 Tax=Timema bartmani TaxID=61472 RepID=A0A7R9EZE6_9NEOP|nr:unnamed protein product [Timema bartmani]
MIFPQDCSVDSAIYDIRDPSFLVGVEGYFELLGSNFDMALIVQLMDDFHDLINKNGDVCRGVSDQQELAFQMFVDVCQINKRLAFQMFVDVYQINKKLAFQMSVEVCQTNRGLAFQMFVEVYHTNRGLAFQMFVEVYHTNRGLAFRTFRDYPRTSHWPLMSSPFPTLAICLSYVYLTKVAGPKLMENRKPFELRNVLIAYNLFQVIFSSWLFYECLMGGWWGQYSFQCQPVDKSNSPTAIRIVGWNVGKVACMSVDVGSGPVIFNLRLFTSQLYFSTWTPT